MYCYHDRAALPTMKGYVCVVMMEGTKLEGDEEVEEVIGEWGGW